MDQLLKQIFVTGIRTEAPPQPDEALRAMAERLRAEVLQYFAGALTIRHVDAGSCNGCELEIHMCNNPYYNLEGLGIRFVASPRHADMLLVTGPVSRHMETALKRTYDATPDPKLVVSENAQFYAVKDSVPDRDRITPPVLDPRKSAPVNPLTLSVHLNPGFALGGGFMEKIFRGIGSV